MSLRKEVNTYIYDPSKRFLNVSVELANEPGALMGVMEILQALDLNILGSFSTASPGSGAGLWGAFLDDPKGSLHELEARLRASPSVAGFRVEESKGGYLADLIHFPLVQSSGGRIVVMSSTHLLALFEEVRRVYGTGGEAILFEAAEAYGKSFFEERRRMLGSEFAFANLKEVLGTYQAAGWFRFEDVRKEEGGVTLRVSDNFECGGRRSARPYSHFVRGHLCGALTALLGKPTKCEETRCVACGDKFCEFVLAPAR